MTPPADASDAGPSWPDASLRLREAARVEALRLGFSRCGFTTADPLGEVAERRRRAWLADGRAGPMHYLERPLPRRTRPRDLLPEARAAIVVLAGYYAGDHPAATVAAKEEEDRSRKIEDRAGKIARYAWGRDYHLVLRERLARLGEWLAGRAVELGLAERPEEVALRPCVDSAPLDERALAVRAGLGFIGKNTLLLTPGAGSWSLVGVLLTSLALPPDPPLARVAANSCGACRRCLEACPTGALDRPYRLDPRRCVSCLTIEQKDAIAPELAARMEGWAFGCDACQEACPINAGPLALLLPELSAERGAGPVFDATMLAETPTGKAFARRWAGTPLTRVGLKGMARNLRALGPKKS
jgi:epoxyqueuosine reductase